MRLAIPTLLLGCALALPAHGAKPAAPFVPSLADLTEETMESDPAADSVGMVWWLPAEFWEASFASNPDIGDAQRKQVLDLLAPYVLVGVVDGSIGPFGGVTFRPEADVRAELRLVDARGRDHEPLATTEVSADALALTRVLTPVLASVIGPMGEHLAFYFFRAKDDQGRAVVDTRTEGKFSIQLGKDRPFVFRHPLESTLPKQVCPKCERTESGAWKFCPYDGTKLDNGG